MSLGWQMLAVSQEESVREKSKWRNRYFTGGLYVDSIGLIASSGGGLLPACIFIRNGLVMSVRGELAGDVTCVGGLNQ